MYINKRLLLLVLVFLSVSMTSFGQRFTKKEQALREARAINYFYGNSFTVSAGYVHGWLATDHFDETTFGRTGAYQNTRESFSAAFAWDYCKSKKYGFQVSLNYAEFGGEKLYYQDMGLGYGPQFRPDLTEAIHINEVMAIGMYRYFIPLTYVSRLSINGGAYFSRIVGTYDDVKDWDLGVVVGLGYDWKHLSVSVNYLPGVFPSVVDNSTTRVCGLMFNVGLHLWK